MVDVLVLTFYDFANTGWRFSKLIESLGYEVKMFKGHPHEYNYPIQAEIFKPLSKCKRLSNYPFIYHCPELAPWVEEARVIHFTSSTFISTGVDLSNKKIVINHGGSTFRQNPARVNHALSKLQIDYSIIQCPDLLGLGAQNEVLIYYPVQTDWLLPDFEKKGEKIVFGHFPSNPDNKGTSTIIKTLRKLGDGFEYIGVDNAVREITNWTDHLDNIRKCDVIIETICPRQKGKRFGEFGNTAFEAAALGKIVITNTWNRELYEREYGDLALHIANDGDQLEARIREILEMNDDDLLSAKKKHRDWVVRNHSMEATAERLKDKVYGLL